MPDRIRVTNHQRKIAAESAMFCKNQKARFKRIFFGQFLDSVQMTWSKISLPSPSTMSCISAHQCYAYQIVCLQFDDVSWSSKSLHFPLVDTATLVQTT
ncbi:hypothetical protein TNCT_455651 [Trichonephila clavata]|uniref:Uncharacterized protein n=1 Tax=Trichonephila clavata TaxID=2740835 RepID=A0A8X6LNS2_TRICU|nr:hypothetical protein TNCT_455651 [Trichonephila clavata]